MTSSYSQVEFTLDKSLQSDGAQTYICSYDTDSFLVVNSLSVYTSPHKDKASVMFESQPSEMFSPSYPQPFFVVSGHGKCTVIVSSDKSFDNLVFEYAEYDPESQSQSKIKYSIVHTGEKTNIKSAQQELVVENKSFPMKTELSCDSGESEKSVCGDECEPINIQECNNQSAQEYMPLDAKYKTQETKFTEEKRSFLENIKERFNKLSISEFHANPLTVSLLVFLLGLIMSLTPCIYPMIPVTIGIIAGKKKRTYSQKLVRATVYICGLATTFALLGLLAASGKVVFGSLLGKPWFVVLTVCFMLYLAGSMFGFYELRVFGGYSKSFEGGGLLSAFLFGAFSGTVSSPCVSPGLLTLLTMIAKSGSYTSGFILLFVFGLGLGFPLWLAAALADSASLLPRAGMWMNHVKKVLGVVILLVAASYANVILPPYIISVIVGILLLALYIKDRPYGPSFLSSLADLKKGSTQPFVGYFINFMFCVVGMYGIYYGYKLYTHKDSVHLYSSFDDASQQAKKSGKYVLLDFTASWCTSCKKLTKTMMKNSSFWAGVKDQFVGVMIDCTNNENPYVKNIMEMFNIKGLPAVFIYDPVKKHIIKSYGSELLDYSTAEIIKLIISDSNNA